MYHEPYKFWLERPKSRENYQLPVMTQWLSEERPNSLIARSQVRISTVHHHVRAALCLLIQQHCWADGPKFKPATICLQEPGTSVIASLIQRSPWRRGHGNDKSGIALASWLWGSLSWYQGIPQELVWKAYTYDETIEICYFAKRYKKIETNELERKELQISNIDSWNIKVS